MEGHYSSTTPYVNRTSHSRTRWRPEFNEYQCDDCALSIRSVYPIEIKPEEGELEHVVESNDDNVNETKVETAAVASPVSEV